MERGRWGQGEFADFARWLVDWINDGRPCRCFVNRGECGRLAFFDLQPAFAWLQNSRRTVNEASEPTAFFVEWTPDAQLTIEDKHFRRATADDDTEVVVELFVQPHIVMRFVRQ